MATTTDQQLDELKAKYASVFNTIQQQGVHLTHVHIQDNKLYIAGSASTDAKNRVWDEIKQVDPNWQNDLICDLVVDESLSVPNPEHSMVQGGAPRTYTVQPGDSLSKIAKQFYGNANEYQKIFDANQDRLTDPNKVQVGQVLNIPQ